jgi:hypothetical protein
MGLCDFYLPSPAFRLLTRGFGTSISRKPSGTRHPAPHASGIDHHSPYRRDLADLRRAAAALGGRRTRHGRRWLGNRGVVLAARGGQHADANHGHPRYGVFYHQHVLDVAFAWREATHFDSQSGSPRNGRAGQYQGATHLTLPRSHRAADPSECQSGSSRRARASCCPANPLSRRAARDFPAMNLLVGA